MLMNKQREHALKMKRDRAGLFYVYIYSIVSCCYNNVALERKANKSHWIDLDHAKRVSQANAAKFLLYSRVIYLKFWNILIQADSQGISMRISKAYPADAVRKPIAFETDQNSCRALA